MKAVLLQAALLISSSVSDSGHYFNRRLCWKHQPCRFILNRRPTGNPVGRFALVKTQNFVSIRPPRRLGTAETGGSINLQVLPKSCFLNCSPVLSISLPPISCADCLSRLHSLRNASYGSLSSIARSISPHSTLETKYSAAVSAFHYIAPHIAPQQRRSPQEASYMSF